MIKNHVLLKGKERITSSWGWRVLFGKRKKHKAVDIVSDYRIADKVISLEKGTVIEVARSSGMGIYVEVRHSPSTVTHYQHLAEGTITVKKGQKILDKQILGTEGKTGQVTGTHLDFQVIVHGEQVNPIPYLEGTKSVLTNVPKPLFKGKILLDGLNCRKLPTKSSDIMDTLPAGQIVGIYGVKKDWGKMLSGYWINIDGKYVDRI